MKLTQKLKEKNSKLNYQVSLKLIEIISQPFSIIES